MDDSKPVVIEHDLERADTNVPRGRITFAEDGDANRRRRLSRRDSVDSMSIHSIRQRRSIDPGVALPPHFRTLSFGIEQSKSKQDLAKEEATKKSKKDAQIDFADVDYHLISVDDVHNRFSSTPGRGLSVEQAARKLQEVGPNMPSPPPSQWLRKTLNYLFGGFGAILFVAAILVFVAWKPLGQPPSIANLALAIVLVCVWVLQASFSFWQGQSLLCTVTEYL